MCSAHAPKAHIMPEGHIIRRSRTSRSAVSGTHRSPSVLKNTRRLTRFFQLSVPLTWNVKCNLSVKRASCVKCAFGTILAEHLTLLKPFIFFDYIFNARGCDRAKQKYKFRTVFVKKYRTEIRDQKKQRDNYMRPVTAERT